MGEQIFFITLNGGRLGIVPSIDEPDIHIVILFWQPCFEGYAYTFHRGDNTVKNSGGQKDSAIGGDSVEDRGEG